MNDGFRRFIILCVIFALTFLGVYAVRNYDPDTGLRGLFGLKAKDVGPAFPERYTLRETPSLDLSDVQILNAFDEELARLTDAVRPSVVAIDTSGVREERFLDGLGRQRTSRSTTTGIGSGVIVTAEGHIITNNHVIADKQRIRVTLSDSSTFEAKLIGADPALDIAILRIEGRETFPHLKFGNSDEVRVGQMVFAVGNPFGLGETITQGIISAKERSLSDLQRDLFQTDAAINPGNSGGPLVNVQGEIIGINAAIFTQQEKRPQFTGVGFSIPVNDVLASFKSILKRGTPVRGFLGVRTADLTPRARHFLNYSGEFGAAIADVTPGSPADLAGLRREDVVMEYGGEPVRTMRQLLTQVQSAEVGEVVTMKVWRKGKIFDLEATIADAASSLPRAGAEEEVTVPLAKPEVVLEKIGLKVRDISMSERANGLTGVIVTRIEAGSSAELLGLKVGDEAVFIDGERVTHEVDFYLRLAASAAVQPAELVVRRDGNLFKVTLPAYDQ